MSIEKFKSSKSEHQYLSALWQVSPNIDDGEIELHEQERRLLLQPTVLELATITLFNKFATNQYENDTFSYSSPESRVLLPTKLTGKADQEITAYIEHIPTNAGDEVFTIKQRVDKIDSTVSLPLYVFSTVNNENRIHKYGRIFIQDEQELAVVRSILDQLKSNYSIAASKLAKQVDVQHILARNGHPNAKPESFVFYFSCYKEVSDNDEADEAINIKYQAVQTDYDYTDDALLCAYNQFAQTKGVRPTLNEQANISLDAFSAVINDRRFSLPTDLLQPYFKDISCLDSDDELMKLFRRTTLWENIKN